MLSEEGGVWGWRRAAPLQEARWGHAAAAVPRGLVVVGGVGAGGQHLRSVEFYDASASRPSWQLFHGRGRGKSHHSRSSKRFLRT